MRIAKNTWKKVKTRLVLDVSVTLCGSPPLAEEN
jgi:hypothetical protein